MTTEELIIKLNDIKSRHYSITPSDFILIVTRYKKDIDQLKYELSQFENIDIWDIRSTSPLRFENLSIDTSGFKLRFINSIGQLFSFRV